MTDGKLDLPDHLLSSNTMDQNRSARDEAWGGTGEEKSLMGSFDESKDQLTSESNIPLSPQWLYAKPVDVKTVPTGASGETRVPISLPHGNTNDPNLKDSWRLDGSQDKKDWRKAVPDIESSRRWREEERETGLLGRRDRRKEDRRAEANSSRDISENRALPSADRWNDPSNRSSGHESRRDSKWSSRWGPDDKEKDSRAEKRTDAEKEDTQTDRQSFVSSNRTATERDNDSRDKWRPRHRMEVHLGGSAPYRSAPGFGLEKGRVEGSNVRFAPGRGRSNINGSLQIFKPHSVSVIGSTPVDKLSGSVATAYCYPRGKLLDIYRKQKALPSFDAIPDEIDQISPITQMGAIEPLAFAPPDAEEEAVLTDIWKGKTTSSGVSQNSFGDKNMASNYNITGSGDMPICEGKQSSSVKTEETVEYLKRDAVNNSCHGDGFEALDTSDPQKVAKETDAFKADEGKFMTRTADGLIPSGLEKHDIHTGEIAGPRSNVNELKYFKNQQVGDSILLEHPKLEDMDSATPFEVGSQLPDDSSSLFDFTSLRQTSNSDQLHLKSNDEAHPMELVVPPEDLSLFYLDPHGVIQGPYMGIDIITWFEQGYFGTDLPVRLSDAPSQSPFQELIKVMPHLKTKSESASGANLVTSTSQLSDAVGGSLEECVTSPASGGDFKGSAAVNDQQWVSTGFEAPSGVNLPSRVPNHDYNSEIQFSDNQNFENFVAQDEEIVFPGRPGSSSANNLRRPAADIHSSFSSPASHYSLGNEYSEASMSKHQDDDKLHPFGLFMSELRDSCHLRCSESSNMASNVGDQGQFKDSLVDRDATFVNQNSLGTMADQPSFGETWSDDYRRNTLSTLNIHQSSIDAQHLLQREQELNGFHLGENLVSRKLKKEQLQQQNHPSAHLFSHTTELGTEQSSGFSLSHGNLDLQQSVHPDVEQLLELEFQKQRQLEFQKQRQLELQQQRQLELQQQRQLELQQQRQLELQQQRQFELRQLELQQQRQLELRQLELQQQRHLELQQQRHLELQQQRHLELQQQRHLELQQQHRLLQQQQHQQLRLNQMKLLQQQQQQQQQQLLLEQLLQHQISDPGYGQLKVDPMRDNRIDQIQLRMHLLQELRQRHLDPSLEQIIQAKIGQSAPRGQPADLLDLISQAKHGNILSSEQQLHFQQEQLQAQNLSMALRQQLGVEGERRITGQWPAEEAGQFARNPGGHHQAHTAGFSAADFYQQQQRLSSHEEQFSHPNWDHTLQERHQRGFYEPSSMTLDNSVSHPPAVAPGMSLDNINRAQDLDYPDRHLYVQSTNQLGSFSSGVPSHSRQVSEDIYASHPDMTESHSSGNNENSWIEKHMQLLNLKSERQRKDSEVNMASADSNIWASSGADEDNSKRAFMDLLRQNSGLQSMQSTEVDYQNRIPSSRSRETFWPISDSHSSNLPFSHLPDQEACANSSYIEGPQNFNSSAQSKQSGNDEMSFLRSNSGASIEQSFLSGTIEHSSSIGTSAVDKDLLELEGQKGKRHGSKGISMSVSEMKDNLVEQAENAWDAGEMNTHGRHSSLNTAGGNGGLYSYDVGLDKSLGEVSNDRSSPVVRLPKGLDSDLNKRPPVSRTSSSQDVLPEPISTAFVKQKSSSTLASDEGKRESVVNPVATRVTETQASGKKDTRFRRVASCGDTEPSFIDMLKKPVAPEADPSNGATLESSDAGASGRTGKKKGKKGRQIDPALLGFKVSSNRIMMGEIQRPED